MTPQPVPPQDPKAVHATQMALMAQDQHRQPSGTEAHNCYALPHPMVPPELGEAA